MGISTSAYFFFGVRVPREQHDEDHVWAEAERLDRMVMPVDEVGYITAGPYDRDELFLCFVPSAGPMRHAEVSYGEFRTVNPQNVDAETTARWTRLIRQAADSAGYKDLDEPGWTVVVDQS